MRFEVYVQQIYAVWFRQFQLLLAGGTPHMKAYDEESVASLSTTQDETQDSFQMNNGTPESAYILHSGYMLAASYWPKVN